MSADVFDVLDMLMRQHEGRFDMTVSFCALIENKSFAANVDCQSLAWLFPQQKSCNALAKDLLLKIETAGLQNPTQQPQKNSAAVVINPFLIKCRVQRDFPAAGMLARVGGIKYDALRGVDDVDWATRGDHD